MSSQDSHSAHTTPEYRKGWDRIFTKNPRGEPCRRHRSLDATEVTDSNERCECPEDPPRPQILFTKRPVP